MIAWDGKTLAADKRMNDNGVPATTTKIMRAPNGALIGASGDAAMGGVLKKWYLEGADPLAYPNNRIGDDSYKARLLVITPSGKVHMYVSEAVPLEVEDRFVTVGSGGDFALAAMHLGCDARKAVELACALDTDCGNGIDTLELRP